MKDINSATSTFFEGCIIVFAMCVVFGFAFCFAVYDRVVYKLTGKKPPPELFKIIS